MLSRSHMTGVAGIALSSIALFIAIPHSSFQNSYAAPLSIETPQAIAGLPIRLSIPKIRVNAVVEYVGVTSDGTMGAPKGPQSVAWFQFGPHPGEIGSAVIAGHYGWKNNVPAVFDDVSKLRKGDTVSVEDDQGAITTFVVRESRLLGEHEDASSVFDSRDGKAHLNLITCEGKWNAVSKSYANRLIVFTDKEE